MLWYNRHGDKMKYKFSAEQYLEIKSAQKTNRDKQIENRLNVLALRCEGKRLKEQYRQAAERGQMLDIGEMEKAYAEKVGHSIGSGQIYRVLQRHGWRKVMPRSKHPKKASEEVIEASKKLRKKFRN